MPLPPLGQAYLAMASNSLGEILPQTGLPRIIVDSIGRMTSRFYCLAPQNRATPIVVATVTADQIHALTFASGMLCSMEWSSGSHTALVITFAAKGNGDGKQPWRHPSCHPCLQLLVEMDPKGRKPLEKSAIDIGKGKVDDGVVFQCLGSIILNFYCCFKSCSYYFETCCSCCLLWELKLRPSLSCFSKISVDLEPLPLQH